MASVTLVLGQPTAVNTAWVQWDVRDQPENLGDITVLSEDPANSPRYLTRLRLFRNENNGVVQLQLVEVPGTGLSGFADNNENLSDTFIGQADAITLQAAGVADLVLNGPDHPQNQLRDASEWYLFTDTLATQTTWFVAYETAGRPALTLILDDGVGIGVDAGDIAWAFTIPEPTVSHTQPTRVDAGDIAWAFAIPQPTVSHTQPTRVDAGNASWAFTIPQPTVTTARVVDAGDVAWAFAVPEPSITLNSGHVVNAGDVSWAFDIPQPTVTTIRVVDAGDIAWAFDIPQPTVSLSIGHAVDAGDVAWAFAVPEASITLNSGHVVNAGDVAHLWVVSQPRISHEMALASLAFNPLAAVRTILRADADVYALTEGRGRCARVEPTEPRPEAPRHATALRRAEEHRRRLARAWRPQPRAVDGYAPRY